MSKYIQKNEKSKKHTFKKNRLQNDQRFMVICMARLWRAVNSSIYIYIYIYNPYAPSGAHTAAPPPFCSLWFVVVDVFMRIARVRDEQSSLDVFWKFFARSLEVFWIEFGA